MVVCTLWLIVCSILASEFELPNNACSLVDLAEACRAAVIVFCIDASCATFSDNVICSCSCCVILTLLYTLPDPTVDIPCFCATATVW